MIDFPIIVGVLGWVALLLILILFVLWVIYHYIQ